MTRTAIMLIAVLLLGAAAHAQPHDSVVRHGIFQPIDLDISRWSYARVSGRTPISAIADTSLESLIRGSEDFPINGRIVWEGPGSGLIVAGVPGSSLRQQRLTPSQAYRHTQWSFRNEVARVSRTWWVVYEPSIEPTRGLVVVLPGMLSTPEPIIEGLLLGLRGQGWTVLRMLAHPSRYTEDEFVEVDHASTPEEIAQKFATAVDDRIGEMVNTVQAALAYQRDVPGPRALVAMSGGTLSTPAILAETGDAFSAAVLIGAGADLVRMSETSAYSGFLGGLRLAWPAGVNSIDRLQAISGAYRQIHSLDPYHAATRVKTPRVLMIQGARDDAVPASLGEVLWERLGKPERWLANAGHEVLFFGYLPMRSRDLLDWIATALSESQAPGSRK